MHDYRTECQTVKLLHEVDATKLGSVVAEMRQLGAPRVRAVWDDANAIWHAAEGTHRLTAAAQLGLIPTIVEISWEDAADLLNAESGSDWTGEALLDASTRGSDWARFPEPLEFTEP